MNILKSLIIYLGLLITIPNSFSYIEVPDKRSVELNIIGDELLSPFTGSSLSLSLYDTYSYIFPHKINMKNRYTGISLRFLRVYLDLMISESIRTTTHEYFGHGFRMREFIREGTFYEFFEDNQSGGIFEQLLSLDVGGFAVYSLYLNEKARQKYAGGQLIAEDQLITIGGIEQSDVRISELAFRNFSNGYVPVSDSILYFMSAIDQIRYVLYTYHKLDDWHNLDGNDIYSYINRLNQMYANNQNLLFPSRNIYDIRWDPNIENPQTISLKDIANKAYFSLLLDPFLYISLYNVGNYIATNSTLIRTPTLSFGNIEYLPRIRAVLEPYGPSLQINNYLKIKNMSFVASVSFGKTGNQSYQTYGIETALYPLTTQFMLGLKACIWSQPNLFVSKIRQAGKLSGGLFAIKAKYRFNKSMGVVLTAGYKSRGYIQGEVYDKSYIARGGISIKLA